jgi:hypothetical protein
MSHTHTVVALLLVAWMPFGASPTQAPRQPKQYTIEQFLNTTSVGGASFSADESRILFFLEQDRHLERLYDPDGRRHVDARHVVYD